VSAGHSSRRCGTCAFLFEDSRQPNPECRLNPPTVTVLLMPQQPTLAGRGPGFAPVTLSAYPPVELDKWCSKWEPRLTIAH